MSGGKAGTLELAEEVFGAVNEDLLWEAITHYRASARAGTHATKNRWQVSGSGKKLWKQKGTGRARVGSIRSPLWRHGGTVHGPVPRSYDYALPKKMILGALRSALSAKFAEQKLTVVDGWELDSHKTKPFRQALGKLNDKHNSFLIVGSGENVNLDRASRNIAGVTLVPPNALQPYDLMRHEHVLLSREAVARLTRSLSATAPDVPVQIEAAPAAKKEAPAAKPAVKAAAKSEAKAAATKKPAKKEAKSKTKPKAKKG